MYDKSVDALIDEMGRCHTLGLRLYNFHPGSTCGKCTPAESIARIASAINKAHRDKRTGDVVAVIENMAGQGNATAFVSVH